MSVYVAPVHLVRSQVNLAVAPATVAFDADAQSERLAMQGVRRRLGRQSEGEQVVVSWNAMQAAARFNAAELLPIGKERTDVGEWAIVLRVDKRVDSMLNFLNVNLFGGSGELALKERFCVSVIRYLRKEIEPHAIKVKRSRRQPAPIALEDSDAAEFLAVAERRTKAMRQRDGLEWGE